MRGHEGATWPGRGAAPHPGGSRHPEAGSSSCGWHRDCALWVSQELNASISRGTLVGPYVKPPVGCHHWQAICHHKECGAEVRAHYWAPGGCLAPDTPLTDCGALACLAEDPMTSSYLSPRPGGLAALRGRPPTSCPPPSLCSTGSCF